MADAVHADIDPVQPSHLQPMLDRLPSKTQLQELAMSNYAVLTRREISKCFITWSASCLYMGRQVDQVVHTATVTSTSVPLSA